ncbi:MAG: peptide-methionine (S)-S-oxide reductase MsrA [Arenimonas sp.]|uniref:peptide-methionine (S)-S-oxide reductase MsrA n=1 Tax=Arenimonas sp. TaxID=1872635 RepID=UPI0025C06CF3|nr:peptide-methionine (S)-S-oxide reductase MsrA [Arenimonas sp.]MBW8366567.1 peptide-methionine (S)-S-oxide reductase MsrA [Arenimonas sp.]
MSNSSCDIPGLGLRVPASQVPDPALDLPTASDRGDAILGGGCFWCTEAVFRRLEGVTEVQPGYAGGSADTADYKQVCSGRTGHAEVIRILYDPARISYGQLLKVFFAVAHDPTQKDRQGNDVGTQYRSALFPADDAQREVAAAYMDQLTAANVFASPLATTIEPLDTFFVAEAYHHDYAAKNPGQPYIQFVSLPKVAKLLSAFPDKLK